MLKQSEKRKKKGVVIFFLERSFRILFEEAFFSLSSVLRKALLMLFNKEDWSRYQVFPCMKVKSSRKS